MDTTEYYRYRKDMDTGDVILWKTYNPLSWLIRKFSKAEYNHTSLIVKVGGYDSLIDRRFELETALYGVAFKSLSRTMEKHRGEAYWFALKDEWNDRRMGIGAWAFDQVGKPYDYVGLFQQIFGRISADMRSLFCSEYAYFAWKNNNIPMNIPLDKDGNELAPRPGDIPSLGILKDYVKL